MSAVLVGVGLLLLTAGCEQPATEKANAELPRNVRVMTLAPESITEYFEISGPVSPVRGTDLSAQESGPVVTIAVNKGATVRAGALIVEQDRKILSAEKDAAAANLAAQQFNVDKTRQLHEAGKVSEIELLTAESAYAQARSLAEVTAERYRRAGIRAPFAGVVADRFVELGELVAPGTPVVRIIDPYTLKLKAYLTDQQVRWVNTGQEATVLLGAGDEPASGTVSWVGFEADRMTGKFKVEIEIPNPDLRWRSGVIGRAQLGKSRTANVIVIPRDAVLNGRVGPTAYVVNQDRAALRQLTLGAAQGLMVVVTDGLAEGERLVVRGQRDLRDGSLVRVTETADTADGAIATDPTTVTGASVGSRVPGTSAGQAVEANR
jgi:RND family efflux transporter MFP subunit